MSTISKAPIIRIALDKNVLYLRRKISYVTRFDQENCPYNTCFDTKNGVLLKTLGKHLPRKCSTTFLSPIKSRSHLISKLKYHTIRAEHTEAKSSEPISIRITRGSNGRFGFSVSPHRSCEIDNITKGSPANNDKLQVGDKIVAIDSVKVSSNKEIENAMKTSGPSITLSYYRAGTFKSTEAVDKDIPKPIRYSVSLVLYGIFGYVAYKMYTHYNQKENRRKKIEGYLPDDKSYKANLPLVKYRGCILPEDMVMSGTMEELEKFVARPEDIIIASFPKSGTTWVQEIVHQICMLQAAKQNTNAGAMVESEDNLSKDETSKQTHSIDLSEVVLNNNETMESRVPYLENGYYPGLKEIEKRKGRRLIKTHLPAHLLPASVTQNSKIIYIYRNPKDVIVSYYHFARMLVYSNYKGTLHRFARSFMNDSVPYSPYFPHINGYRTLKKEIQKNMLIFAYEDIKEHPKNVIREIASFIVPDNTCSLNEEEIEVIERLTSFESMKKDPRSNYEHWDTFGIRNLNESPFMRAGVVGDFKNHMQPTLENDLNEWIQACQESGDTPINFKFSVEST